MPLDFGGRVVIVTGAGRGLGRAYRQLFGSLGAHVVANDIDAIDGVTSVGDVGDATYARQLVTDAMEQFGRVDALVNNAGTVRWAAMPDIDVATIEAQLRVHAVGAFNTIHAAWPHMTTQSYGRIVNTTSSGVFGLKGNVGYAAAKGAVIGLTRTLAVEGAPVGIKVNAVAPAAATRLGGNVEDPAMAPELAAPLVAYLAHHDCPVNGEIYSTGAGRTARVFLGSTEGAVTDDVVGDWDAINDATSYYIPADLMDWSARFLKHL